MYTGSIFRTTVTTGGAVAIAATQSWVVALLILALGLLVTGLLVLRTGLRRWRYRTR